jgi:putative transposase
MREVSMDACPMELARSHRLRIGRQSESGRLYLVTFTTYRRQRWFCNWEDARCVSRCVDAADTWPSARVLCWTLMPDHWHGLLELGDEPLSQAVARAKAIASRQWHRERGRSGKLWAPGFHDHGLRRKEDVLPTARYIVANPVRAGLTKRVGSYPYWNSIWL